MSAIQPGPQIPLIDQRTGLVSQAWFDFFTYLTRLPSARLSAPLAYNPPNLAPGAGTSQDVTVPNATLGWQADATFSLDLQGLAISANVKAADTVTVVLFNPTAGAINLAAGTLTAFAWKP